MSITELDDQQLTVLESFFTFYRQTRIALSYQYQAKNKLDYCEREITIFYKWLTQTLVPSQVSMLSAFGYYEVVEELDNEMDRWQYERLPVAITY
jgi:hypothetical protein